MTTTFKLADLVKMDDNAVKEFIDTQNWQHEDTWFGAFESWAVDVGIGDVACSDADADTVVADAAHAIAAIYECPETEAVKIVYYDVQLRVAAIGYKDSFYEDGEIRLSFTDK